MNIKKNFFIWIFLVFLLKASLLKAINQSNHTLSPKLSQHSFELSDYYVLYQFSSDLYSLKGNGNGYSLGVRYLYGLSSNQFVGAFFAYQNTKLEVTVNGLSSQVSKTFGPSNSQLIYGINADLGQNTFYGLLAYSFGLEKAKSNNDTRESTTASGQNAFLIHGGLLFPSSFLNYGTLFQYTMNQDGESESLTSGNYYKYSSKGGGGTSFKLYIEVPNKFHPNISFYISNNYSRESISSTGNYKSSGASNESYGLELSGRYSLKDNFELLPFISSNFLKDNKLGSTTYSKYETYIIGLNFRLLVGGVKDPQRKQSSVKSSTPAKTIKSNQNK